MQNISIRLLVGVPFSAADVDTAIMSTDPHSLEPLLTGILSTVAHLMVNEVLFFYVHKKMHEPVRSMGTDK